MSAAISVIIPTYNRVHLMARAIRSALAAIHEGDEILVIDDGSTDNTGEVVRSFGEPVRYHRIANAGPGAARNAGIRLAQNDLLAFLDSDDEYYPDKLLLQRQVMQKYPNLVFSFGNIAHRGRDGLLISDMIAVFQTDGYIGSPFPTKHAREILGPAVAFSSVCKLPGGSADFGLHIGSFGQEMMDVHYAHSNTVLVRRSKAGAACAYPEDARLMEDWEFMTGLARQGPVAFLDREVAILNEHEGARLVAVHPIYQVNARLRVLQRAWGAKRGAADCDWTRYDALVRFYRLKRAKILLGMERLKEARADFDASGAPLSYRLFTRLPDFFALPLYRVQLRLKKGMLFMSL